MQDLFCFVCVPGRVFTAALIREHAFAVLPFDAERICRLDDVGRVALDRRVRGVLARFVAAVDSAEDDRIGGRVGMPNEKSKIVFALPLPDTRVVGRRSIVKGNEEERHREDDERRSIVHAGEGNTDLSRRPEGAFRIQEKFRDGEAQPQQTLPQEQSKSFTTPFLNDILAAF